MNAETIAAGSSALASAAAAAEDALQLEREALAVLLEGWTGESASAAADFIAAHCEQGQALVSALRRGAEILSAVGDPAEIQNQAQARLAERPPANFASAMPPAAPPAAPSAVSPMTMPMPALPDFGGAISALIAQVTDALDGDPVDHADTSTSGTDSRPATVPESVATVSPPAQPVSQPAVVADPAVAPAVPVSPGPPAAPPLLPAEVPPPRPATEALPVPDRTPCEIAADELPQVGE